MIAIADRAPVGLGVRGALPRRVGASIFEIFDRVVVVVGLWAPVLIFEAVFVLGLLRASIEFVDEAVAIAIQLGGGELSPSMA